MMYTLQGRTDRPKRIRKRPCEEEIQGAGGGVSHVLCHRSLDLFEVNNYF